MMKRITVTVYNGILRWQRPVCEGCSLVTLAVMIIFVCPRQVGKPAECKSHCVGNCIRLTFDIMNMSNNLPE
jgi:hypothetical protein